MAAKATNVDVTLFQIGCLEHCSTVSSLKIAWTNYETSKRKLHIPVFVTETMASTAHRRGRLLYHEEVLQQSRGGGQLLQLRGVQVEALWGQSGERVRVPANRTTPREGY